VAVEPHPATFEIMKGLVDGHPIIPLNVAAYNGVSKRVHMTTEEGGNLGISKSIPADEGVEAFPLSHFLGYFDHSDNDLVLKVDIEGSEYDFLLYASGTDIRRFQTIFLETHQAPHLTQHAARKCEYLKTYMSFLGYEIKNEEIVCMWQWDAAGKVVGCKEVEGNRSIKLKRIENWK
jgi:FkbM family methyltransferase